MAEASSKTGDQEEISACSLDSLSKLCEKHSKILFIATKEDRKCFVQKFTKGCSLDDIKIVPVQAGGSCEINGKLGLEAPSAVLMEKGEVKCRIPLEDDDVTDTAHLMKALSEKPSDVSTCGAELKVNAKTWGLKLQPTQPCKREISNLSKLPHHAQKYFTEHIETGEK